MGTSFTLWHWIIGFHYNGNSTIHSNRQNWLSGNVGTYICHANVIRIFRTKFSQTYKLHQPFRKKYFYQLHHNNFHKTPSKMEESYHNLKEKNKRGNAIKKIDKLKLTNMVFCRTIARMDNANVQNYAVTEAQCYTIQLLQGTVDRKSNLFAEQDSEINRLRVFKESLRLEFEFRTIDIHQF